MTENRFFAAGLRSLACLVALAGMLGLSACGGGSGAPNNVFNPSTAGPLTVLPSNAIAYSGVPMTLTVSGGTAPYTAFSSNAAILPVTQAVAGNTIVLLAGNVSSDTAVTITVQDSSGGPAATAQSAVAVTVRAAPLVNSLTITPNLPDCGTTAICSGQTGTATVSLQGPQGGPLVGHQVRFDVVAGAFLITTTNPAQPLVTSLTVVSDANGVASVIVKANVDAPTQFAQLRVTDITSGQQLTGIFLIQQVTDGTKILTIVPNTATITGPFTGVCSTGFATDYYIYGGTPPYRVTSTFPSAVTLVNPIVNVAGGFFEAITNGTCVTPLTFSILDATGRQTTATLNNNPGTATAPIVTPPDLGVAPASYTFAGACPASVSFIVFGGTPPYNVNPAGTATATPQTIATSGGSTLIGVLPASSTTTIVILDSSIPQKSKTVTVQCGP